MDLRWSLRGIICVILMTFIPSCAKFIKFKPGYEYEYKFESNADLVDYGNFNIKAKVSLLFIILYKVNECVYSYTFKRESSSVSFVLKAKWTFSLYVTVNNINF